MFVIEMHDIQACVSELDDIIEFRNTCLYIMHFYDEHIFPETASHYCQHVVEETIKKLKIDAVCYIRDCYGSSCSNHNMPQVQWQLCDHVNGISVALLYSV